MPKVLLDTDILSEYFKGHDRFVVTRASEYMREHERLTFTSVTVHEIMFGLAFKGATSQLEKVSVWFGQNDEITPIASDYRDAAAIKAAARNQGMIVELADCLIAAVAIRLDLPLETGNTSDFQAIQKTGAKLVIENWRG